MAIIRWKERNNESFIIADILDWEDIKMGKFKITPSDCINLSLWIPSINSEENAKKLIEILKALPETIRYFSLNIRFYNRITMLSPELVQQLLAVLPDSIQHLTMTWEQIDFLKKIKNMELKWPKNLETLSLINYYLFNQTEFLAYSESLSCLPSLKSLRLEGRTIELQPSSDSHMYNRFIHLSKFLPTSLQFFQIGCLEFNENLNWDVSTIILKPDLDTQIRKCILDRCPQLKSLKNSISRELKEEKPLNSISQHKDVGTKAYKYCGIFSTPKQELKESKKNSFSNSHSLLLWGSVGVAVVAGVSAALVLNRRK
jgi:hypothetical protein